MDQGLWQAYAIRYAWHHRTARENFLTGDVHDGPMPIDYFIWAVISGERAFVIDTGFDEAMARKRGRNFVHCPGEGLRKIGIDPAAVQDVLITHMHYDHCGNHDLFPAARYHVQDREMRFSTGRYMTHPHMRFPFDEEDVIAMVRRLYRGRLVFHDGDEEIAPGLSLHRVGGHSMGLQMVRVRTRSGYVVLASDATHFYANIERGIPYPIVFNAGDVLAGYKRAYELAESPDHVIPGHDPLVLERYPPACPDLIGWIARLD
ncbi:MAG: N-acyl homoserine lactonase family protein [Bryobacterales bacterium]|nr:N-acyl homoserine lactonase family protein [Bryobacterales bacterium]MBV9401538.1 N-acyl homoserine lactonase family protein [Bryobacterales bacterium]